MTAPVPRRAFGRSMLPSERPAPPWGAKCRVCGEAVAAGDPVLFRAWGVEYAHPTCGWLRADELEPHELRGAEQLTRAWEWACPGCRVVVVAASAPSASADLRCSACSRPVAARHPPCANGNGVVP